MKKMLKYTLFALLLVSAVLALASCGHQHEYAAEWSTDGSHHWHAHTCQHEAGERIPAADLATHTFGAAVTVAPGTNTTGKETRTCTVCGYTMESIIPATGE